jgi:hypothetical protein
MSKYGFFAVHTNQVRQTRGGGTVVNWIAVSDAGT